jgi:hypothetical protein
MAEALLNPWGDDDDDFQISYLIDRNFQVRNPVTSGIRSLPESGHFWNLVTSGICAFPESGHFRNPVCSGIRFVLEFYHFRNPVCSINWLLTESYYIQNLVTSGIKPLPGFSHFQN